MAKKRVKYSEEDYIKRCKELKLEYIGYYTSKNSRKDTIIQFICPRHENKGVQETDWGHFRVAKKGCPYCAGRYKTTEDIKKEVKNPNVEIISKYLGNEKPIKCRCKVCGNEWTTVTKCLTTNGAGCPKCGKEKAIKGETKSHSEFVKEMANIRPDIEIVGQYDSYHRPVRVKCKKCGYEWESLPASLYYNNGHCKLCYKTISYGEKKMLEILKKFKLNVIPQYRTSECRYKHTLAFDAMDLDNKIAFEFNGGQHYVPTRFSKSETEEDMKNRLIINQTRDNLKKIYCNKQGIDLIEIPYWETDNMESFILEKIKQVKPDIIKNV